MVLHFVTRPYTHQQQGKAERKHRSIVEIGLTLLAQAAIDLKFWWEAFLLAACLLNRLPTPVLKDLSPFECLFGYKPDYHFLKVFGCSCFPYLRPYNKHKLAFKTSKCVFLGYSPFHKGYKCLHPSGRIYIARSVTFDEHSFPYQQLFVSQSPTAPSQNIRSYGAPSFVIPSAPVCSPSKSVPASDFTPVQHYSSSRQSDSCSEQSSHVPLIQVPFLAPSSKGISSS